MQKTPDLYRYPEINPDTEQTIDEYCAFNVLKSFLQKSGVNIKSKRELQELLLNYYTDIDFYNSMQITDKKQEATECIDTITLEQKIISNHENIEAHTYFFNILSYHFLLTNVFENNLSDEDCLDAVQYIFIDYINQVNSIPVTEINKIIDNEKFYDILEKILPSSLRYTKKLWEFLIQISPDIANDSYIKCLTDIGPMDFEQLPTPYCDVSSVIQESEMLYYAKNRTLYGSDNKTRIKNQDIFRNNLGIQCFGRYNPEHLEEINQTITSKELRPENYTLSLISEGEPYNTENSLNNINIFSQLTQQDIQLGAAKYKELRNQIKKAEEVFKNNPQAKLSELMIYGHGDKSKINFYGSILAKVDPDRTKRPTKDCVDFSELSNIIHLMQPDDEGNIHIVLTSCLQNGSKKGVESNAEYFAKIIQKARKNMSGTVHLYAQNNSGSVRRFDILNFYTENERYFYKEFDPFSQELEHFIITEPKILEASSQENLTDNYGEIYIRKADERIFTRSSRHRGYFSNNIKSTDSYF